MVYILLGEGFEEVEALVPTDMLRRAGIQVSLVGVAGRQVTGGNGITVLADCTLDEVQPEKLDMVVIPGGLEGVQSILASLEALTLIQRAYHQRKFVAAICAGPTVLARLGMLDGRRAVCYPTLSSELGGALVQTGQVVVRDENVITCESGGSCFPFAFALIEALRNPRSVELLKNAIYYHD